MHEVYVFAPREHVASILRALLYNHSCGIFCRKRQLKIMKIWFCTKIAILIFRQTLLVWDCFGCVLSISGLQKAFWGFLRRMFGVTIRCLDQILRLQTWAHGDFSGFMLPQSQFCTWERKKEDVTEVTTGLWSAWKHFERLPTTKICVCKLVWIHSYQQK